jgi:hypothetical protein
MRVFLTAVAIVLTSNAWGQSKTEVICSYAPSQSAAVAAVSGAAGGSGATAAAIASATGLTAVTHSSGALILTGSSGYIAGTLGATASTVAAAPVVVAVGLIVGGSAVTLELICASRNHPEQVAKITEAAAEFSKRFSEAMRKTTVATESLRKSVGPMAGEAAVRMKTMTTDVWEYVYARIAKSSGSSAN